MDGVGTFDQRAAPQRDKHTFEARHSHTALVIRNVTAAFARHSWALDAAMSAMRKATTDAEMATAKQQAIDAWAQAEQFMDKNLRTRPEVVTHGK
jgi:hypothetical protein